ncbi:Ribose transport ATP-binding protein RbsA [Arthrobacter sp. 9V]|uniref:sugar ABC transporter ATP-binding protein n=1 Tax=Arthrobacter sp. 9V TaxID=2653132 RepID=UPI0012F34681|nr:sugar ABC transporter ATP-binding protein [Arthrobacter sp. 9V]VXC43393.1 Ribose transport ATP-binding protein RbsA [Arthrobacter sp. 9V]
MNETVPGPGTGATTVLRVSGLSKKYGPAYALKELDLELKTGEVVGLIGQNGAGKSTLLKLLTGVEQPDHGKIELHGRPTTLRNVADAGMKGIGIVFQEQSLVPNLTVAENLLLGRQSAATAGGILRWSQMREEAQRYLSIAGSSASPDAVIEDLSFVDRQSVELAKVLALEESVDGPLIILFDEPTSVLTASEIEGLFSQIRRLRSRAAIVFVSHRMDEVLAVSDRVLVLRDGEKVAEHSRADVDGDDLYRLMVGSERADNYYYQDESAEKASTDTPVVLSAQGLSRKGSFRNLSFDLHAGQIIGIAGVIGSGRESVCRALYGADPLTSGQLKLDGTAVEIHTPSDAVRKGIGFIPAERRVEGMVTHRSVTENLVLTATPSLSWKGLLRRPKVERRLVADWARRLKIKMDSPSIEIQRLSGGNQQKVVLAKWLALPHLRVLILDHPTRGLDAGAKGDVYRAIRDATKAGIGVVLLSDTLEELMGLADQVVVMRDGVETGRFDLQDDEPSSEDLVRLMV